MRHRRIVLLLRPTMLALPLMSVLACGGAKQPDESAAAAPPAAPAPPVVTITASDYAYEMPDTIVGGLVTLRLVNKGPGLHHVQLERLSDGKTFADLMAAFQSMQPTDPPPAWMHNVAGPNAPAPGGEQLLTTTLEPGNYAVVCFVDVPDRVPHLAKGMVHALTVVAPTGPAPAEPVADLMVDMSDYAWSFPDSLSAGRHVIKLTNSAAQPHEIFVFKLDAGKSPNDVLAWGATYAGPPPGTAVGGSSAMTQGDVAYIPMDLTSGTYVLLCFVPDAKDGKPHVAHGMVKTFTVG